MNVETRKHLKPGPPGAQPPLGSALREMVDGRYDRVPDDMERLLGMLERPPRRAA